MELPNQFYGIRVHKGMGYRFSGIAQFSHTTVSFLYVFAAFCFVFEQNLMLFTYFPGVFMGA